MSEARSLEPTEPNMVVIISAMPTSPSAASPESSDALPPWSPAPPSASEALSDTLPISIDVMSKPVDMIWSGYSESVSSSTVLM